MGLGFSLFVGPFLQNLALRAEAEKGGYRGDYTRDYSGYCGGHWELDVEPSD